MTTYYPTLDQFWPAVRAKNFVKELGEKPGNYAKNMEILASIAGVHVKQMCHVNPVTFAERHFHKSLYPTANLQKLLGYDTYRALDCERSSPYIFSSAMWAYHKKQPIPPYVTYLEHAKSAPAAPAPAVPAPAVPAPAVPAPAVPAPAVPAPAVPALPEPSAAVFKAGFEVEFKTIVDFMAKINGLSPAAARFEVAIEMFNYIMTIEPFLRRFPKFCETCLAKVIEFKGQDVSYALRDVLLKAEDFLTPLCAPPLCVPPKRDEDPWCGCKDCPTPGTTYHANNTEKYGEFLEILKDYVGGDCWAIKVNDEVLFDCYQDLSVKEQLQASILRDKIEDCPHLLFTDMFTKKKNGMIVVDMHSNAALVVKITYRASDETLTLLATSNL